MSVTQSSAWTADGHVDLVSNRAIAKDNHTSCGWMLLCKCAPKPLGDRLMLKEYGMTSFLR
jgi:hypothetical protein